MSALDYVTSRGEHVLVIPNARVDDVSAATGPFIVGPPSPLALCGLAHKIGLDMGRQGVGSVTVTGAALAVHEFSVMPGHPRFPPEMRGEQMDKAGAMIDDPRGRLRCSVVLAFEATREVAALVEAWASRNVQAMRLGGGRFVSSGIAARSSKAAEPSVSRPAMVCSDEASLAEALRVLPPGAFISDRSDLLGCEADSRDALDAVLDAVARFQVHPSEPQPGAKPRTPEGWARRHKGWIVPVDVGFRALSRVAARPGLRDAAGVIGHAWTEGVISLGEWVSARQAVSRGLEDCLWRHDGSRSDEGIWTVSAVW